VKKEEKVAAVERRLDNETPKQRRARRMVEEYTPLAMQIIELQTKMGELAAKLDHELKEAQTHCKHVDEGDIFYGVCKLCGLVFD
jgi:hypothetical protein